MRKRRHLVAGRKPKEESVKKYKEPRKKRDKPYNYKPLEKRGLKGREGAAVKSFWKEHTMDQIETMTQEELDLAIDKYLDAFIERQIKNNKRWNFPESLDFRKFK